MGWFGLETQTNSSEQWWKSEFFTHQVFCACELLWGLRFFFKRAGIHHDCLSEGRRICVAPTQPHVAPERLHFTLSLFLFWSLLFLVPFSWGEVPFFLLVLFWVFFFGALFFSFLVPFLFFVMEKSTHSRLAQGRWIQIIWKCGTICEYPHGHLIAVLCPGTQSSNCEYARFGVRAPTQTARAPERYILLAVSGAVLVRGSWHSGEKPTE